MLCALTSLGDTTSTVAVTISPLEFLTGKSCLPSQLFQRQEQLRRRPRPFPLQEEPLAVDGEVAHVFAALR